MKVRTLRNIDPRGFPGAFVGRLLESEKKKQSGRSFNTLLLFWNPVQHQDGLQMNPRSSGGQRGGLESKFRRSLRFSGTGSGRERLPTPQDPPKEPKHDPLPPRSLFAVFAALKYTVCLKILFYLYRFLMLLLLFLFITWLNYVYIYI